MNTADEVIDLLRDSAVSFIGDRHNTARMKGAVGHAPTVDRDLWREMAELGWLTLGLPETLGGSGLGLFAAATLADIFGRAVLPEPFVAAAVMPGVLLARADSTDPLAGDLARYLASGERLLSVAWQERTGEMQPTEPATRIENGRVFGSKCFVPAVEEDSILLVSARHGDDSVIVAVDVAAGGVTLTRQAAGIGSVAQVALDGAPILNGSPLLSGCAAEEALRAALEAGRVCAAAGLAGIAEGALTKTLDYLRTRVQFERALGSFQTLQHRCVDMKIDATLAGAAWRNAARRCDAEQQTAAVSGAVSAAISAAKARSGDAALTTCRAAVQMHGAMGFTEEADIGLYLRAAMYGAAWLGGSVDHRRRFVALASEESADV